jgi:hypothetical protein
MDDFSVVAAVYDRRMNSALIRRGTWLLSSTDITPEHAANSL